MPSIITQCWCRAENVSHLVRQQFDRENRGEEKCINSVWTHLADIEEGAAAGAPLERCPERFLVTSYLSG